ncbi:hypothetical protein ACPSVR_003807 [Yersinia enterocolitica]|nr:hypothetical protein [Yersinia enterocolitica]EKN3769434.1 hypothetical protein [Yersinia enterocolitica]EKN4084569.1 hypothetical protein [Yersinia enterocolitica]ELY5225512.1 hypothetical protein [Yersinia enterocolitica]EMB6559168.1 hypothetical protein [Yersinia enterocolitica]
MYSVISALLSKCEPIDPFTIQEAVPAGTKDMVLTVSSRCKSSANIKAWAKRVRQCWMLRKGESEFIRAAEILRSAGSHNINECIAEVSGIVSRLQFETNLIFRNTSRTKPTKPIPASEIPTYDAIYPLLAKR